MSGGEGGERLEWCKHNGFFSKCMHIMILGALSSQTVAVGQSNEDVVPFFVATRPTANPCFSPSDGALCSLLHGNLLRNNKEAGTLTSMADCMSLAEANNYV